MQNFLNKSRELLGVICKDFLKYKLYLLSNNDKYLQLQNRLERVAAGPNSIGYVCLWEHTSRLHAPLIIPNLGLQLLKKCLTKFDFELVDKRICDCIPRISVLIGHRGMERLPLLLTTIKSIASQIDVNLECIIIEQDTIPRIKEYLPDWVGYLFLQTNTDLSCYNRSAGFNLGAAYAKGEILLLHDNDMLVSKTYCRDILRLVDKGFEALNTKRYVFYLKASHSKRILDSIQEITTEPPEYIVQNLEAGGSMAITKKAYMQIGGMDEEFIGWGGEDIEFWNRCSLLNRWIWGYEPVIHLWHKNQPLKSQIDNPNIIRTRYLDSKSIIARINSLKTKKHQRF
jgi:hypothetical protein